MKVIRYENGYKGMFDETFKPGDLITTYNKGFHEFVCYEDRSSMVPLIHYRRKFQMDGKPINTKIVNKCDAAYCRRAEIFIKRRLVEIKQEEKSLKAIAVLVRK